jgi:hypothetical protein
VSDDLDRQLRERLRATRLPAAPDALHDRIRVAAARPPAPAPRFAMLGGARLRLAIAIALLLLAGLAAITFIGAPRPWLSSVDGLPVMTVSQALAAHAARALPGGRAAIQGWWSSGQADHGCAPPPPEPNGEYVLGDLELYCHDGEWGITELDEPMFVVQPNSGLVTYEAKGPHLTPFVPQDLEGGPDLFALPRINGQPYAPVPIVVVGHFDDPRAAQCRESARQLCLDRLVLDRIVSFEPDAVATPGVTPSPTPFPSPGPSGLFGADRCAGNVPYSFVGWTTTGDLQLQFDRPGHVWAMVTQDPVLLTDGGFTDDPNGSGHKFEIFARRICIAEEGAGNEGTMEFGEVPGSAYVLWDDGLKVPGTNPLRP